MRVHSARGWGASLLAAALALLSACIEIPATNPYDEDAPPDLQVKATLVGHAAYPSLGGEAPEPPEGILVEALRLGADEPAKSVVTSASRGGRFELEVPGGTYLVRASAGLYAPALFGPVDIAPGARVDVGALTLSFGAATSSLSGAVTTSGGLSPVGIQVALKHRGASGACGGVEAETTTAADGSFSFDSIRPGTYKVIARTEGATIDVQSVDVPADTAVELPAPLALQPGTGVVQLEADGARPTSTTRTPSVTVHVLPLPEMTEMQIGLDPTFDPSYGATGWQPFQEQRVFDLVDVQDQHTVFVQLRSSCTTSPLYGARVVYDHEPPELLAAQVAGVEVLNTDEAEPVVVVGDNRAAVSVSLSTLDLSGVAEVRLSLVSEAGAATQVEQVEAQPGQAVVRVEATLPEPEGSYLLDIRAVDLAGNETPVDKAPRVRVLRDFSPPTTPVPLVDRLSVTGPRALIWLAERECDDGSRAVICETNPHPEGSFLVRGGPAFLDFTPVAENPIEVEVDDDETLVEIRARDAGGSLSPGIARVEVLRVTRRSLFSAPATKELGPQILPVLLPPDPPDAFRDVPRLFAAGGTAFVQLRPRTGVVADTYYSYLVGQPADLPDVSLEPRTSVLPRAIRKLSVRCYFGDCSDTYNRLVGGLGAGGAAFTWLERLGLYSSPQRPFRHVIWPDADGRYDLRGPELDVNALPDEDGDLAPAGYEFDACARRGGVRCAEDPFSWAPHIQLPPHETAIDGTRVLTAGASQRVQRFAGDAAGELVITGPYLLALVVEGAPLADLHGRQLIGGVAIDMDVPAGTPLWTATYSPNNGYSPSTWSPLFTGYDEYGDETYGVLNVATGAGVEVLLTPRETFASAYYDVGDRVAIGVLLPPGVTATVPLVDNPEQGFPLVPVGTLSRAVGSDAPAPVAYTGAADDLTAIPSASLLLADRDLSGVGTLAGLAFADWGSDAEPSRRIVAYEDLQRDPTLEEALRDERSGILRLEEAPVVPVATAGDDELFTPSSACTVVLRPRTDVLVRGVRLRGAGFLDDLGGLLWERKGQGAVGRYDYALLNPVDDYFPTEMRFESPDGRGCDEVREVLVTDSQSGTATSTEVSRDEQSFSATATVTTRDASGTAPGSTVLVVELDPPAQHLPVNPNDVVRVTTTGTTGDLDLYVRFNAPPTFANSDCSSESGSSNESCELTAGALDNAVYVGVAGYGGPADFEVHVEVQGGGQFRQVASYAVQAGQLVNVATNGTGGDIDLYVRFDAEPTYSEWDCRPYQNGNDEACTLAVPAGASRVYVAVDEYEVPVDYTVTTAILDPTPAVIGTYDVSPGQVVSLVATLAGPGAPVYRGSPDAPWSPLDCQDDGAGVFTCQLFVPAGVTSAQLGVQAAGATVGFTADVTIEQSGCDVVEARAGRFSDPAVGLLRAGRYYLLSLGDDVLGGHFGWPDSGPAVYRGAPTETGYVDVLGSAPGASFGESGQFAVVPSVDPASPLCRVELDAVPRTELRYVAMDGPLAAASRHQQLPDGREWPSVVAGRVSDAAPLVEDALRTVHVLEAGWRVLDVEVEGDRARWVQTDDVGLRAGVYETALEPWDAPFPAACRAVSLPVDLEAAVAAFDGDRVAVAGRAAGRDIVEVYALTPAEPCSEGVLVARRDLEQPARALALSGEDLFVWHERVGTGGTLSHQDLRDVTPLHPGGSARPMGFDAREGRVVASLVDAADPGRGRLLLFEEDAAEVRVTALREGPSMFHPSLVGQAVAFLRAGPPDALGDARPELVVRSLDGAAEVVLASSAVAFSGAPPLGATEPLAFAREEVLASDGARLATLGFDEDGGRRLLVFDLPEDPALWASLAPSLEVRVAEPDEAHDLATLLLDGSLVGVTFASAPVSARVFSDAGGAFEELPVAPRAEEKVVGAHGGRLLVLENPGEVYGLRPRPHTRLFWRAPTALGDVAPDGGAIDVDGGDAGADAGAASGSVQLAGRLPAGAFVHALRFVGEGADGDLLIFDEGATPPVLWRVDAKTGFGAPGEGPHRPLTLGADSLGGSALPRAADGALYFLRRIDSGIALVRYRPLMP